MTASATYLLVVLTIATDGGMSAAFVNTAKLEDCERQGKIVQTILRGQKIKTPLLKCFSAHQRFTPYEHNVPKDRPRHTYRLMLDEDSAEIELNNSLTQCTEQPPPTAGKSFCVTSTQALIQENNDS